ncbi:MAG: hypothetical protein HC905_26110 [Bacteroidales bacterium]|nr:hypothetical protein [Bacteroidales bacterium]
MHFWQRGVKQKTLNILLVLIIPINLIAQSKANWTELDYLNFDTIKFPFQRENDIVGNGFVILSDTFDYYKSPIIIASKEGETLVKIEVTESDVITTFKGVNYSRYDTTNPVMPWLYIPNPDYFRLAFEYIDSSKLYFNIKINENTIGYINKNNKDFKCILVLC